MRIGTFRWIFQCVFNFLNFLRDAVKLLCLIVKSSLDPSNAGVSLFDYIQRVLKNALYSAPFKVVNFLMSRIMVVPGYKSKRRKMQIVGLCQNEPGSNRMPA